MQRFFRLACALNGLLAVGLGAFGAHALKTALFRECRPGYVELAVDKAAIKTTIFEHPEFVAFTDSMA